MSILSILTYKSRLPKTKYFYVATTHLPVFFFPWIFSLDIGLNMLLSSRFETYQAVLVLITY